MTATATAEPETTTADDEDEPTYADGPLGRAQKLADDKDAEADRMTEAGDDEGATIARVEADEQRSKIVEFEKEAGEAVGAMPSGAPDESTLDPETIVVAGMEIAMPSLGGKRPTGASLKLVGTKVELAEGTGFKKGMRIKFHGEAVVNFVGQKDKHDSATQQVTSAEQRHEARVVDLHVDFEEQPQ